MRAIAPPAKRSIRHAAAHSDPPAPPLLRVDGFLLDGDKIVSTRTTTPREYEAAWERQRIANYLHTWARLQGERPLPPLPCALAARLEGLAPVLRRQVAKAEKMRRYRDGNPEGVLRAQEKYWKT